MKKPLSLTTLTFPVIVTFSLFCASSAQAQYLIVNAEQVKEQATANRNLLVVDVRTPDEYREGHIPGAVNIQPESIGSSAARLPKDKTAPIIFYCRGIG